MKLLDYSGLQRFLNKIKTLLDSKSNTGHTHVTSEVTDLLNSQHTWSAQQSYSADLNLNYASTDVDDILDTVAGSYTAEDFLAQNNVWTGDNTYTKAVGFTKVNDTTLYTQNSRAELGETNLSGDTYTQISFEDKNGDNFGYLRQTYYVDGDNRISIYVRNKFTSGAPSTSGTVDYAYFGLRLNADKSKEAVFRANLRPYDSGNAYNLGDATYQWNKIYGKEYYYNGTEFQNKFVTLDTDQVIVGAKKDYKTTYSDILPKTATFPSTTKYYYAKRGYAYNDETLTLDWGFVQSSGLNVRRWYVYPYSSGDSAYFQIQVNPDSSDSTFKTNVKSVIPVSDNATDLGSSTNQWKKIYSADVVHTSGAETIEGVKTLVDYWRLQAKNLKAGEGETYGRTGYSVIYTDKNGVEMGDVTLFKNSGAARSYLRIRGGDYYTNGAPAAAGTLVQSDLRIGTLANGTRMIECYTDAFYPVDTNTTDLGTSANQWKSVYAQTYYYNGTAWGLDKANRFTACQTISGSNVGGENTSNYRTVMALQSNKDTNGKSCMYITKFRQNKAQGSMGADDLAQIAIDVLENEVRTNNLFCFGARGFSSDAPSIAIFSSGATGSSNLGTSATPWTNIYGTNLTVSGTGVSTTPAVSDNSGKIATTAFVRNAIPYIISGGANTSAGNITPVNGTIISGFADSRSVTLNTFGGVLTSTSALYYATCIYNTSDSTMAFSKGLAVGGTGTWKLMGGGATNPGTSTKLLFGLWIKIA